MTVIPDPVHIAQTVTVGLTVVLPVFVHVTRHLLLSSGQVISMEVSVGFRA
jgi:uncharacterized membrane protein